jgi:hypothetical protein
MRNREDLGLESAPVSVLRTRNRVIAFLILHGLLFGVLAFVTAPRIIDPIMTVPPNRYFQPRQGMLVVAAVAYGYGTAAWLFIGVAAGAGWLSWTGRLDRFNRFLLLVVTCSCLGAMACIGYSESLPSWVEKNHGARARERMFEGRSVRLLPDGLFR